MLELKKAEISYVVIVSDKIDDIMSVLWAKEYKILPIKGYYRGNFEESIIAFKGENNDDLRKDTIFILEQFNENSAIIKYKGDNNANKIFSDGSEKPMDIKIYDTNSDNFTYIYNGVSFSFVEQDRYWKPKGHQDLRKGMIVEYFNKNKWFEKRVNEPKSDWSNFFKLFSKYDKLRVKSVL